MGVGIQVIQLMLALLVQVQLPPVGGDDRTQGLAHAAVHLRFADGARRMAVGAAPFDEYIVGRKGQSPAQDGRSTLSLECIRSICLHQIEQGRHKVDMTEVTGDLFLRSSEHGRPDQHRDANRLFIHEGLAQDTVVSRHFPVVTGKYDDGIVRLTAFLQRHQDLLHRAIHQRDVPPVSCQNTPPAFFGLQVESILFGRHVIGGHQSGDQRRIGRWRLHESRANRQRPRIVEVIERPGMRRMRFEVADTQCKRPVTAVPDELRRLLAEVRSLGKRLIESRLHMPGKYPLSLIDDIRLKPVIQQKVMIRTEFQQALRRRIRMPVGILTPHPGVEPMLRKNLIAEMPLSHVSAPIRIRQHLCDGRHIWCQRHITGRHTSCMGPQPRHHRRP